MTKRTAIGGIRLALAGAAAVTLAVSAQAADEQAELVAKGREMVEANCKRCHALGMDDKSPHANAPPFRLVAERYPSENLAEALAEGIVAGHPDMPVFVMKPEQIEAFLAYLNSLTPSAPTPAPAPDKK